jgi:hypothetical protein
VITLIALLAFSLLVTAFFIWLLRYCLRVGAVGGGASGVDAYRDKQPIRFWIGIAGIAAGAIFGAVACIFEIWSALRHP